MKRNVIFAVVWFIPLWAWGEPNNPADELASLRGENARLRAAMEMPPVVIDKLQAKIDELEATIERQRKEISTLKEMPVLKKKPMPRPLRPGEKKILPPGGRGPDSPTYGLIKQHLGDNLLLIIPTMYPEHFVPLGIGGSLVPVPGVGDPEVIELPPDHPFLQVPDENFMSQEGVFLIRAGLQKVGGKTWAKFRLRDVAYPDSPVPASITATDTSGDSTAAPPSKAQWRAQLVQTLKELQAMQARIETLIAQLDAVPED